MKSYIRYIVRYRFLVLAFLVVITLLSGVVISHIEITGSLAKLFLGESAKFHRYIERVKQFGSDTLIIIAFEESDLFSRESILRLKAVVQRLREHPEVKDVKSILDLPDIQVVGGVPRADLYVDIALKKPERIPKLLEKLGSDPMYGGLIISKDGRHSLVIIELTPDETRPDETLPPLIEEILEIFELNGFERTHLHQAGQIPILVEMLNQARFNIMRLFPIVCLVLFVTVYILFQKLWPVFITLMVTIIAVAWTLAFAILLFGQINIMTAVTPGIIIIIAFSDVVHLCSSYHLEISKGERKEQAIERSCSEVGTACLFTSITTFFGFISLALVPAPLFRQMGVVLGVGVGLALVIATTLTPVIFSLMRAPKPMRVGAASQAQLLLYKIIDFLVGLTRRRPWIIVTAFVVLLVSTVVGVTRIDFETNITKRLAEDNPIRIDSRYFAEHFDGTNYVDIFVETPEPRGLVRSEILSRISAFQDAIVNIPEVDKVLSIVDLFERIHRLFNSGKADGHPPPMSERDIVKYLFLFQMSGSDELRGMIDADTKTARLRLSLNDDGFFATHRVAQKALAEGKAILGDDVHIEVTGITALLGEWVDQLIDGQKRGLIFAFLTILVMMIIALRSFSGGLWSMLPNTIPLLMLGGYVGWFWNSVDSDTIIVAIIAIGISVDDTIHFLFRYRFERERTNDVEIALDRTFHFSGRAIIITSIILVVGFAPYATSDFFSVRIMGTLLPATLVAALLTDLLLVPALIKLGAFRLSMKTSRRRDQ